MAEIGFAAERHLETRVGEALGHVDQVLGVVVFRFGVVLSNWTTAKAVCPSADTCWAAPGASGLRTLVTFGSGRRAATSRSMVAALAGSFNLTEV